MYDFLIVGSGLFGLVFSDEVSKKGYSSLIIDKRNHFGGNVHCENISNINVHKYGPHIFHTNNKKIWEYVNKHAEFSRYTHMPMANYNGNLYNLPFNMNTFYQVWNISDPALVRKRIDHQIQEANIVKPSNLEEQAISMVGSDLYNILIKGYTEKQWGRSARDLPTSIITRLPVRLTYDNNYFNDSYQGIPIGGYNKITESLLGNKKVILGVNYFDRREYWDSKATNLVYTGAIDEYFEYRYGQLEYRSLRFDNELLEQENFQGVSIMNFTDSASPYTRIVEHKHFENSDSPSTVITKEYPQTWDKTKERYYPVNDSQNNEIYRKYDKLARKQRNLIIGGRLGKYKYYDMHQVIASAISKANEI